LVQGYEAFLRTCERDRYAAPADGHLHAPGSRGLEARPEEKQVRLICCGTQAYRTRHDSAGADLIPGHPDDYFVNEQVALWGIDQSWNLPHDPRVPYYRAGEMNLGNGKKLFHFVIPMFPENWLDKKVVSEYVQRFEAGDSPTAVSISMLGIKGPATWQGEIDPTEHWFFRTSLLTAHGISARDDIEKAASASAA